MQERNLIYLVPLLFVGTALWIDRPRLRWIPLAAAVGFVAYLIVATPYQLDNVPAADSLGVAIAQMWNRELSFAHGGIERGLIVALVVAVVLLVLPRFLGRRPGWILGVTSAAAVLVLAWGLTGQISAANYSNDASQSLIDNYPRPLTWLDEKTHGKPTLYLGQHLNSGTDLGVWLTEFWNRSLRNVWSVDGSAPGPGPTQTPNTHADGRLYPPPPGGVDYVLAEPGIELDGTLVGRPPETGRWFLYRVKKPLRYAFNETGVFADGQTGCDRAPCPEAESAYNRFSTPGQKPGYAVVDVSRVNACGAPVPPAGRARDDREARRGTRQAAAHRTRDRRPALDAANRLRAAFRPADAETALPRRGEDLADLRTVHIRRLRPAAARRPRRLRLLAEAGQADRDAATM